MTSPTWAGGPHFIRTWSRWSEPERVRATRPSAPHPYPLSPTRRGKSRPPGPADQAEGQPGPRAEAKGREDDHVPPLLDPEVPRNHEGDRLEDGGQHLDGDGVGHGHGEAEEPEREVDLQALRHPAQEGEGEREAELPRVGAGEAR